MSAIKERLEELKKQKEELLKKLKTTAKEAFKEMSAPLFQQHPALVGFSWSQYTPYFCDGDPCRFSVYKDSFDMVFLVDGEEVEVEAYGDTTEEQEAAKESISEFLDNFDDDDFKAIFGDHVRVTVTAKGASTDEYDHD